MKLLSKLKLIPLVVTVVLATSSAAHADNVYVSEEGNDRIQKFDSSGTFVTKWGTTGTGEGEFYGLTGIATGDESSPNTTTISGSSTTTTSDSSTTTTSASSCSSEQIYGEHSEQTELLRHFRDKVLIETPEGREIIQLYYQWSPVIVQAMENDAAFKKEVKKMIDGVVYLIMEETE